MDVREGVAPHRRLHQVRPDRPDKEERMCVSLSRLLMVPASVQRPAITRTCLPRITQPSLPGACAALIRRAEGAVAHGYGRL